MGEPTRERLQRLAGLLFLLTAACAAEPAQRADLVVVNADVRTADPNRPSATALAIRDGRFVAVGDEAVARALAGSATEVVDAAGVTILPGFIDGHTHFAGGASLVNGVDLTGIADKQEWLRIIERKSSDMPEGQWLLGGRWDHTLSDGILPTREDLDSVAPGRPVSLSDIDGHSRWVNSKALDLAGITAATAVPPGGEIVIDPRTGEPTGILLEGAGRLVARVIPRPDDEQRKGDLRRTIRFAFSLGITSAHDMSGSAVLYDYLSLLEAGEPMPRIWFGGRASPSEESVAEHVRMRDEIEARVRASGREKVRGPLLRLGYLKAVADGVLSTHTAALLEPYSDRPDVVGEPFLTQQEFDTLVALGNGARFPVAVHAIGDRAIRMTLDAFEKAGRPLPLRNRIEHIEVLDGADLGRFADLDVAASMQPDHAAAVIGKYITERIGTEREKTAYVWQDLLSSGAHLVLGSDWPTAPLNPLIQLADAVFRESPAGLQEGTWHPENALTFEQALYGYTQAGADMTGWGSEIGSISEGKWADFVMLDGRLATPLDRTIRERSVARTFLAGTRVYP